MTNAINAQVGGNHYKKCVIQPAVYNELNDLSFLEGNIVKYITRYKDKNGEQDLDKIIHCTQLLKSLWYGPQEALAETIRKINEFIEQEEKLEE